MTVATLSAANLVFEPVQHEYRLPDGRRVPSVTEILGDTGISVNFRTLGAMGSRLEEQIEARRQLGSAVHADCHALDDEDLDWATVDPRVEPYIRAWATFLENKRLVPLHRERRVFHPTAFYCGTLDGIFSAPSARRVLVDIKIGDPEDAGCRFQTAGYEAAYRCEHPDEPSLERWGVQLVPDAVVPYRIFPYLDWRDGQTFQAFVTTFHHQANRRRAA